MDNKSHILNELFLIWKNNDWTDGIHYGRIKGYVFESR
jgi:hypothetical protein